MENASPPNVDAGKVLCIVAGICVAVAICAVAIYMAQTRYSVKWHAAHPQSVLTSVDIQSGRHAMITAPKDRVPKTVLPKGAVRTPLSNYPIIDQIDVPPTLDIDADALATMIGMPASHATTARTVPAQGTAPGLSYKSPDAVGGNVLGTAVVFQGTGGGIAFPYFSLRVQGASNRVVMWLNATDTGHLDPRTMFQILPNSHATITHFLQKPV